MKQIGAIISIHQTLSDHVAGATGAPLPLLDAHVADVASAPLPLLFLVLCRWLLAVVVVAVIVKVMSDYVRSTR